MIELLLSILLSGLFGGEYVVITEDDPRWSPQMSGQKVIGPRWDCLRDGYYEEFCP